LTVEKAKKMRGQSNGAILHLKILNSSRRKAHLTGVRKELIYDINKLQ
jgi:hypothetical protein